MSPISRRGLLAAMTAWLPAGRSVARRRRPTSAIDPLLAALDVRHAVVVGREYARRFPKEASEVVLRRRLQAELAGTGDLADAAGLLLTGIRRDYTSGRTCVLRGWLVSRTEGRLCALAALTARAHGRP